MTIETTDPRRTGPTQGNGVTTSFPFDWKVFADTEVQVIELDIATGVETIKTLTTHYTVSLNPDQDADPGGAVVAVVAPTSAVKWTLLSNVAARQPADLITGGGFSPGVIEDQLDRGIILVQQLQESQSRSLLLPPSTEVGVSAQLPSPVALALIGWNSSADGLQNYVGGASAPVSVAMAPVVAAATEADAVALLMSGSMLMKFAQSGVGAVVRTMQTKLAEGCFVSLKDYGATGDGVTDDTAAVQAAITYAMANNRVLFAPAGTYLITSALTVRVTSFNYAGVFGPGLALIGEGIGRTIFDSRVASGALFDIDSDSGDSHATFKGVLGVQLEGFTIKTGAAAASSTGIKLRTTYMVSLRQIHIAGLTGNGIEIVCTVGDNDAPNMVSIEQVRIDSCATWGIKADAASGFNETSFVHMRHVFIQTCGTTSASTPPPSGGMIWKGQILTLDQCGFVVCENVGLYVPGQSGLGQIVDMQTVTFENNKKRGFYSTGLSGLRGRLLQFYNNDGYTATNAFELDGSTYTVRNIEVDGAVVRATSGNSAYTAFKISGGNAVLESCRVRRVTWDNFDYAGQTRFSGWQFDHVEAGCSLIVDGATSLVLRPDATWPAKGNKMPLRLRGGAGGTPSTSGEIIDVELATSGIGISNSGLSNNTRYYCYLYDNSGTPALELSTTAFATNAIGYSVKTGDATRIYVGSVETDGSAQFKTTAGGWLNPLLVPGSQVGTLHALWVDSGGKLRIKTAAGSAPTSDTDGTVVGTQT